MVAAVFVVCQAASASYDETIVRYKYDIVGIWCAL